MHTSTESLATKGKALAELLVMASDSPSALSPELVGNTGLVLADLFSQIADAAHHTTTQTEAPRLHAVA